MFPESLSVISNFLVIMMYEGFELQRVGVYRAESEIELQTTAVYIIYYIYDHLKPVSMNQDAVSRTANNISLFFQTCC